MEKIFFEMNDKEKQLVHIGNMVDYAICILVEGLSGTGDFDISTDEVIQLQAAISEDLISAHGNIQKLLNSVQEQPINLKIKEDKQ